MLREYAIEPEALAQHPLPLLVLTACGPHTGRYVVPLQKPRKWRKAVSEALQARGANTTAGAALTAWLEDQLNTSSQDIYVERRGRPYDGNRDWLANALAMHLDEPLTAILTQEPQAGTAALRDAHDGSPWWAMQSSVRLIKRPEEYARVLGPALRRSSAVRLIDGYFEPRRGYRDVLAAMLQQLDATLFPHVEVVCQKITSARNPGTSADEFLEACARHLSRIVPERVTLTVRRLTPLGDEKLHDRYLFTDRLNLTLGYGFDGSDDEQRSTTVALIGPGDAQELQGWIDDPQRFQVDALWSGEGEIGRSTR